MEKHHILWADDDMDDLMLMRHVLNDLGTQYKISEVHNGQAAIDFLNEAYGTDSLPCLIILDMNMPVLNGKETLTILKKHEHFSKIPVVFFTTSNSEMDRMFCRHHNVEMVTKPPQYANLKEAVRNLLDYCLNKN